MANRSRWTNILRFWVLLVLLQTFVLDFAFAASLSYNTEEPAVVIREARLILPQKDNDGNSLVQVRDKLELRVLTSFGGFTSTEGVGGWESGGSGAKELHHEREPVWIYDIACVDNSNSESELLHTARWMKEAAAQESVYLRFPNGTVKFV